MKVAQTEREAPAEKEMMLGGGDLADYAETTKFNAYFSGKAKEFVTLSAAGYIRTAYREGVLLSLGWVDNILADGEAAPAGGLVIQVLEVNSPVSNVVPEEFDTVEIITTPVGVPVGAQVTAVFCYTDPGTLNVEPAVKKMKRTRINIV